MTGSAVWNDVCPPCNGTGKIQVWDKKHKKILPDEQCPACDGRGKIMIKQVIHRKKI